MTAPGIEPKFSASGDPGERSKRFKKIDFMILRTYRMKAIPAGPRVESNIGQHDTKRRSERQFQGDFEANNAHSDVYSFVCWKNANVPNGIEVVKNMYIKKQYKHIQNSVSRKREHGVFRIIK